MNKKLLTIVLVALMVPVIAFTGCKVSMVNRLETIRCRGQPYICIIVGVYEAGKQFGKYEGRSCYRVINDQQTV